MPSPTERGIFSIQPESRQLPPKEGELPAHLDRQLTTYLSRRKGAQENLYRRLPEQGQDFFRQSAIQMINSRNRRAEELESEPAQEAAAIAERIIPNTYFIDCMDKRVQVTIKYGIPLGVGGSMRRPAGDMADFEVTQLGGLDLIKNSPLAQAIDTARAKSTDKRGVTQVLDSHIGCAARELDESAKGTARDDKGLFEDVVRKKEMALAISSYKDLPYAPVQTSFDPHTGDLYMGLEKDNVLDYAEARGIGFAQAVLDELVENGEILSSRKIREIPAIKEIFDNHEIEGFDWDRNYPGTLLAFWKNMEKMIVEDLLLEEIYPYVNSLNLEEASEEAIWARTTLMALNAYNSYHLNKDSEYPYSSHDESWIVITEGESGPFAPEDHPAFVVYSKDTTDYGPNVTLAASLIRGNRVQERISDTTGQYEDRAAYLKAPVPVAHHAIIREDNTDWDTLNRIVEHKDFLPDNWFSMDTQSFQDHLATLDPQIDFNLVRGLDTLRKEVATLYDPSQKTSNHIFNGHMEVLPVIVDSRRRVRAVVPFVHEGAKFLDK
jgi:hypothetical protein